MKVKELLEILQYHGTRVDLEDEVVIPIAKDEIGGIPFTEVTRIVNGIDWDRGKLFFETKEPLVIKTDKESVYDMAVEFMMWLATKPNKRETYEIREAKRILDRAGVEYMKHRKFLHRDKY